MQYESCSLTALLEYTQPQQPHSLSFYPSSMLSVVFFSPLFTNPVLFSLPFILILISLCPSISFYSVFFLIDPPLLLTLLLQLGVCDSGGEPSAGRRRQH